MLTFHLGPRADHTAADRESYSQTTTKVIYDGIHAALKTVDWSCISAGSVEDSWNQFRGIIKQVEEKCWMTHKAWKTVRHMY